MTICTLLDCNEIFVEICPTDSFQFLTCDLNGWGHRIKTGWSIKYTVWNRARLRLSASHGLDFDTTLCMCLLHLFWDRAGMTKLEKVINLQTVTRLKDQKEQSLNTPLPYTDPLYRLTTPDFSKEGKKIQNSSKQRRDCVDNDNHLDKPGWIVQACNGLRLMKPPVCLSKHSSAF